jgi:proteic killer suppression protein
VIRSFRDTEAGKLLNDEFSRKYQVIERVARRNLMELNEAETLQDLAALPGSHLEALLGDRKGRHGIRIDDRYRLCFVWSSGHAFDVEIVDYH